MMGQLLSDGISVSLKIPLRPNPASVNLIKPEQKLDFPDPFFTSLFSAEHSLSSCRNSLLWLLHGLGNYHFGAVHRAELLLSA